jgi:L-aminopeptidase/D-esterase-like protein
VLLTGGSAFGLDAASGVVRWLERRGIGFPTRAANVPIVPAAVLYDLGLGRADVRPDAAMGEAACVEADRGEPVRQGNAGAGCGATVGKVLGPDRMTKGGLGSASAEVVPGVRVGAIVAVNAFGDVVDPATGAVVAGPRTDAGFASTVETLRAAGGPPLSFKPAPNTVLAVVATNAALDKEGANVLAQMATAGITRTIRPAHAIVDGDTVFALAAGEGACDVSLLGAVAAEVVAQAALRGVRRATSLAGVRAAGDAP